MPTWSVRSIYVVHTGLIYVDNMYVNCVAQVHYLGINSLLRCVSGMGRLEPQLLNKLFNCNQKVFSAVFPPLLNPLHMYYIWLRI